MSGKKIEIPAERPVGSGELVEIRDLPAYKQKHGLRTVAIQLVPEQIYPRLFVEVEPPETGKDPQ